MALQLVYTSSPRGLKAGAVGFCVVACTRGISDQTTVALEALAGYRRVYSDPAASSRNPISYSHFVVETGVKRLRVLARVADAGLDYSGRTNKIASFLEIEPSELVSSGPAALFSYRNLFVESWGPSDLPKFYPAPVRLPFNVAESFTPLTWERLAGDRRWAGVLAATVVTRQPATLIVQPGQDVLRLFQEALALLPPAERWNATFSTYYMKTPPGVSCQWKAVMKGSPEEFALRALPGALTLDLTNPSSLPSIDALPQSAAAQLLIAAAAGRVANPDVTPMEHDADIENPFDLDDDVSDPFGLDETSPSPFAQDAANPFVENPHFVLTKADSFPNLPRSQASSSSFVPPQKTPSLRPEPNAYYGASRIKKERNLIWVVGIYAFILAATFGGTFVVLKATGVWNDLFPSAQEPAKTSTSEDAHAGSEKPSTAPENSDETILSKNSDNIKERTKTDGTKGDETHVAETEADETSPEDGCVSSDFSAFENLYEQDADESDASNVDVADSEASNKDVAESEVSNADSAKPARSFPANFAKQRVETIRQNTETLQKSFDTELFFTTYDSAKGFRTFSVDKTEDEKALQKFNDLKADFALKGLELTWRKLTSNQGVLSKELQKDLYKALEIFLESYPDGMVWLTIREIDKVNHKVNDNKPIEIKADALKDRNLFGAYQRTLGKLYSDGVLSFDPKNSKISLKIKTSDFLLRTFIKIEAIKNVRRESFLIMDWTPWLESDKDVNDLLPSLNVGNVKIYNDSRAGHLRMTLNKSKGGSRFVDKTLDKETQSLFENVDSPENEATHNDKSNYNVMLLCYDDNRYLRLRFDLKKDRDERRTVEVSSVEVFEAVPPEEGKGTEVASVKRIDDKELKGVELSADVWFYNTGNDDDRVRLGTLAIPLATSTNASAQQSAQ